MSLQKGSRGYRILRAWAWSQEIGTATVRELGRGCPADSVGRAGGEAWNKATSLLDLYALQGTEWIKDSGVERARVDVDRLKHIIN